MFNFLQGEILLINKPYGWTSFDVVCKIRLMLKQHLGINKIKVGHTGTLDPLATGLLIICTGKFTRKTEELQALDKTYTGTFRLGTVTASFDLETPVEKTSDISHLTEKEISEAVQKFIGKQKQIPPMYSAIKIGGRRAYELARNKQHHDIEPKEIYIKRFEITSYRLPEIDFIIECSKGTYIRAIARDLGNILGCGATLSALCRTSIGNYSLDDAITPEQFEFLVKQLHQQ